MMTKRTPLMTAMFLALGFAVVAQDSVRLTTWNVEHLGTEGRGFGGGYGAGDLSLRTETQLRSIGRLIRDEVGSHVVALQEIGIRSGVAARPRSDELDVIASEMGTSWRYYLPPAADDHDSDSMYVAFLWNSDVVRAIELFPLSVPNYFLAGKNLFDRTPIVGYFEALDGDITRNDFLVVNVHLASGQDFDENHLIAMTLIEHSLHHALIERRVSESDRIILGDFNDNPYAMYDSGTRIHTDALYRHMEHKGYDNFVTPGFHATRMNDALTSVIDHVLVNDSAQRHVVQTDTALIYLPPNGPASYSGWRQTYSDHFPISIDIEMGRDDDVDWTD